MAIAGALLAAACSDAPVAPVALSVGIVDGGTVFRSLRVELDRPATVEVVYWSEGTEPLVVESEGAAVHEIALPRLRAATRYDFVATPAAGEPVAGDFTTDSLPARLRGFRGHPIGRGSSPLTIVEAFGPGPVVLDAGGEIVWHPRDSLDGSQGFTVRESGEFVTLGRDGIRVIDPASGVTVGQLSEAAAGARVGVTELSMHHDVIAGSGGSLLILAHDTATVADTLWTGEAIWAWTPATGALEKRWSSFDHLDPRADRGARTTPDDWLHANSLSIGPRGNVVVSLFWTNETISLSADFATLEWRLGGERGDFEHGGELSAGQHTSSEVAPGRVLLFDNGWDRPSGELYSRAVELSLDTGAGRASIAWEFRPSPTVYAPIVGSARRLANGNTHVFFGTSRIESIASTGPIVAYEVTPAGEVVWAMPIDFEGVAYRATPLESIAGERAR